MKRALPFLFVTLLSGAAFAQCSPNQLYADSVFGVWPDTTQGFAPGYVGVFYSDTLNILPPANAGAIDPALFIFIIDSIILDSVSGLPPGFSVICNSQTGAACTYLPEQVGCGLIQGTPATAGVYPISLHTTVNVHIAGLGSAQALPYVFPGYSITISMGSAINEVTAAKLSRVSNSPNPVTDRTTFEFSLAKAGDVKVKVYDLVGAEMWSTHVQGKPGINRMPFDASTLESGIYLYTISTAGTSFTARMVVGR